MLLINLYESCSTQRFLTCYWQHDAIQTTTQENIQVIVLILHSVNATPPT